MARRWKCSCTSLLVDIGAGKFGSKFLYWSRKVEGVNPHGTLFDVNTGRKVLNDSDIKVNSKYYLLTNQYVRPSKDVVVEKLFIKKFFRYDWTLY